MTSTKGTDAKTHLDAKHGSNIEPSISKLRRLNDALTIHQLPIELLLSIFERVLRRADTASEYYRQICTLSGVCARWLSIVHRSPQLWTTVTGNIEEEGFRRVVERSSDNLIDVERDTEFTYEWRYGDVHFVDFLGISSSATRRLRSLVLGTGHYSGSRPSDLLQFPAPNLERLVFKNDQGWDMEDVELFGGTCPNLKHIHLERTTCKWSQAAFKKLESLKLSDMSFDSAGVILDIVRDIPQLKTLELSNCDVSEMVPANTQQVSLPNLQLLRAELYCDHATAWATQGFLDHISVPPQCPIFISLEATDDGVDLWEESLIVTFCQWFFGKQTKEVLEGVESLKLACDINDEGSSSATFELLSDPANIKGGIREFGLPDLLYVLEYIQGLFQKPRVLETFTKVEISGGAVMLLNHSQFTDALTKLPPITHLELVKPEWDSPNSSSEDVSESEDLPTTSPLQTIKSLTLRDVSPDSILDMVLGVLGDSEAHPQMSQCQVERLDSVEIHVQQEEFNKVESDVEVLRNDSRIGKVDVYVAL